MPPACSACRSWQHVFLPLRNLRRYHVSPHARAAARQGVHTRPALKETSRILQFFRTSSILAPFRRMKSVLDKIPGSYRRFIGNTLQLTPIFLLVFLHFPYQIMHTNGSSMSPFLNPNNAPHLPESRDKILVKRLGSSNLWGQWLFTLSKRAMGQGPEQPLQRGEIVVFLTPHDPSKIAVKRVVGLPGDIITPLEGYEGAKEVTVQHQHIWVEGDADDREKSRDSNWYGPISQNLVLGRVVAIMEPFWRPRWLAPKEHQWPARQKGRVAEDAVRVKDSKAADWKEQWLNGGANYFLSSLETKSKWLADQLMVSEAKRQSFGELYSEAWKERSENDPQTKEGTGNLIEVLDGIFTSAGLQLILDEHNNPHLVPTKEGEAMLKEHLRKKSPEEKLTPEQLLQHHRAQMERSLKEHQEQLDRFDDWAWYKRYRPKSILQNRLDRAKGQFEEQQRLLEKDLAREKREEEARLASERQHGHRADDGRLLRQQTLERGRALEKKREEEEARIEAERVHRPRTDDVRLLRMDDS